ncbi:MAG: 30S ribosomal protein S21 [bacterium]|nr:30S ribosomal protein S21 [bacterium]
MSTKNATIIEVKRRQNETPGALVRRFSKKAQQAGIVRKTRSNQFRSRPLSHKKRKQSALRRMARLKESTYLRKIGKLKKKTRTR